MLTKWPQTPKGRSPYAGPFLIIEVLGRYSYQLSDGQKWNSRHLIHSLPNPTEWTKLSPLVTVQPQGGVGDAAAHEAVGVGIQEAEQGAEEEAILPGLVAVTPVEPQYPTHE